MMRVDKKIYVTRPSLPPLEEFLPYLEKIWESRQLTNMGPFHEQFEKELAEFLGVKNISLLVNGTVALMVALKALDIRGEVITTPFSFAATSHVLQWNDIRPVFVDIEPDYYNIDPEKIRDSITKETKALLPVHVFGNPCNNKKIDQIAKEYKLPVIYDACHAFGVKLDEESILNFGDLSVVSFHATKSFNTFEGGAIISKNEKLKSKIDRLRNYGFVNETKINGFGINGKLNEFQAALGLLQLKHFEEEESKRIKISDAYKKGLEGVPGISYLKDRPGLKKSQSFFPILVDPEKFGETRDFIYRLLVNSNIFPRRYFYPLISDLPLYRSLPSASKQNLPVSSRISQQILCLPVYADLDHNIVLKIIEIIRSGAK
jgi:dTDP-4-amino-4,6-dideoxy-D-glucose transaminase